MLQQEELQTPVEQVGKKRLGRPVGSGKKLFVPAQPAASWEDAQRASIPSKTIDLTLNAIRAERGLYENMPAFQRGKIWTLSSQRYLIDTILRGFPVPPILLNRTAHRGRWRYEVVDGQQRLGSIMDFFDGKFTTITQAGLYEFDPTPIEVIEPGKRYHQLSPVWQGAFDSYSLRCVVLDNASGETLSILFRRLQNQQQLSHGELLWSYTGKGAELAKSLMKNNAWADLFKGKTNRRQLYEVCLDIITIEAYGVPVSLRTPVLQTIASPLGDNRIDTYMESRIIRRLAGMQHIFKGVNCTAKNELVTIYQAAVQLERARIDVLHSQEGCCTPWYSRLRTPADDVVYFWGIPHVISQIHNLAAQKKLWDVHLRPLLATPGLYRPPVFMYNLSARDLEAGTLV